MYKRSNCLNLISTTVTKFYFFEINQILFLVYSDERDAQFTLSRNFRVTFNWIKPDLNRRYVNMI